MHISFLFSRPTGPAYRPSLFIFFDFHVFRISRPRCLPEIPGSYSGYSHWGSAWDGLSSARACPPSRLSTPDFHFSRRSKAPFFSRSFNLRNAVFSHNFFGCPSGFVESDTTTSRNFEFRDVVVSDSTKPDENKARFVVLLVSVIRAKSATWGVLRSRADIGGMAGLLVAPEARNTAQVIPGPVSGNGRVSGNANLAHLAPVLFWAAPMLQK